MDRAQKLRIFTKLFPIRNRWKNTLYLHFPFCLQRCKFCVYLSKVPDNKSEVARFVQEDLSREVQEFSSILTDAVFDEVYLGGGTPTMASPESLDLLFQRIPSFRNIKLKATEASPRTIRNEHVELFASWGFSYVSIGVQTLDLDILRRQNRESIDVQSLARIIGKLDQAGIVVNVDLIFFLGSGTIADLGQAGFDLRRVIDELHPKSITVHSDYNAEKTIEKQLAMIRLIRAELQRAPEYVCTNSLLLEEDANNDRCEAAEYRLMRRDGKDFSFYLLAKVPQVLRFGYNVLGLGEYEIFKLRSNYFCISDFYPPHAYSGLLLATRSTERELSNVRRSLGIPHPSVEELDEFFTNEAARAEFVRVIQAEGFPAPESSLAPLRRTSNSLHATLE